MKAIIIGGGIGGLSMALSLNQAGIEAKVFESVKEIGALGSGINLQANAVRELDEMGLCAALYATGHHLAAFEQNASRVTANFIDRAAGGPVHTEHADLLIGADGIHSAVRAHFYPTEGPIRYSGEMQWRALVEMNSFLDGRTQVIVGHRMQRLVGYSMSNEALESEITLKNRELGPKHAMQIVEDRAPDGFGQVEDVISIEEMAAITENYKRSAGFDSESVNERASYLRIR